jgi:Flp pilus assembly protein TadD
MQVKVENPLAKQAIESFRKKDFQGAENLWKKALELNPQDIGILTDYASYLGNIKKDLPGSEIYFQQILQLDPHHLPTLINCGSTYLLHGNFERAEQYLKKALKIDPNNSAALVNYASVLMQKHDVLPAEEYYMKAVHADPKNSEILSIAASFLRSMKQVFLKVYKSSQFFVAKYLW